MSEQEKLTDHVNKLQKLLADPHPQMVTWAGFYAEHMKFISDFWNADNKLMQAAPDLLEALKELHFEMLCNPGEKSEALKQAERAIAKATA
jgi:hypothetical protein